MYLRYKKENNYSYTLGVYPTLELLNLRADRVISVIISKDTDNNTGVDKIIEICKREHIIYEINDKQIKMLSDKGNVYAVGVFNKYKSHIADGKNTLLLVNPENAGNVGTIIRSMLGFGVDNLAMISPAVDIFNPEVIRSSMGSVFKLNFEYFTDIAAFTKVAPKNIYTFVSNGSTNLPEVKFAQPFTLIFGSESAGLSDEVAAYGKAIKIPMSDKIDSYNLGISVSIALYQASC